MDPEATLELWRAAPTEDHEDALAAAHDLRGWLQAGGCEPAWVDADERAAFIPVPVEIRSCATLDVSGASNDVYAVPREETAKGTPYVFVVGLVGPGVPERAYHGRWLHLGSVKPRAHRAGVERVLRHHQHTIASALACYLGTTFDGSNHVGKWAMPAAVERDIEALAEALQDEVPCMWDCAEYYEACGLIGVVGMYDRDCITDLDKLAESEVDAADGDDAVLDQGEVRDWLLREAQTWLANCDFDDDAEADLREIFAGWIAGAKL